MNEVLEHLLRTRITVIYRGIDVAACVRLTAALREHGLRSFEVTTNSPEPFAAISALRKEFGADVRIGAGTVLEPEQVERAAVHGAEFVISPNTDAEVIAATKRLGLVSVPGAFTPSEVVAAVRAGADIVKVFPINAVGADYLAQLRGPLSTPAFMATGGVTAELARECFAKGASAVGIGTRLLGVGKDGSFEAEELATAARSFRAAAE
ncbi:bifunctional 4-hydroxy-2-oxoglutarate aldolase/2-dehydro-3-deoxy-phosphogluconate aldolase [Sciscionella marina]|uniref:bifunctional 4-hydroxy-2-oxoglutarate aldolase/2-dehydro-3-deoxy-phosphogluconate aldolase n=1 Tax=Sciscionella marina TaxID=508770 RepID=UPI00036588B9|nr:bifunctional 4-hydroxy-2-oxoglutarate aldolase/2-dehydro-3-deoxy-phosphogluconate aldolase [Sciscionella marina]